MESISRVVVKQTLAHEAIQGKANRGLACTELFGKRGRVDPLSGDVLPGLQASLDVVVHEGTLRVGRHHYETLVFAHWVAPVPGEYV